MLTSLYFMNYASCNFVQSLWRFEILEAGLEYKMHTGIISRKKNQRGIFGNYSNNLLQEHIPEDILDLFGLRRVRVLPLGNIGRT